MFILSILLAYAWHMNIYLAYESKSVICQAYFKVYTLHMKDWFICQAFTLLKLYGLVCHVYPVTWQVYVEVCTVVMACAVTG